MIDGKTQILGLLGHQISHTLSPRIHNFSAQKLGLNCVYLPFDVAPADLSSVLPALWRVGAIGFNVTVPHKLAVGELVTGSPVSVNTLYRQSDTQGHSAIAAASTDGVGFCRGLAHLGRDITSYSKLIVLGSGGASQALLSHFAAEGYDFADIALLRRSPRHDSAFTALPYAISFAPIAEASLRAAVAASDQDTLLIQATSAPLRGDDLSGLLPALQGFSGTIVDLVYGKPSALWRWGTDAGLPCQDGLPMLIEQARASQELWWQQSLSYSDLHAELHTVIHP